MLTDEEIAYMFRRAADVLEGVADPSYEDEPGPYDDAPPPDEPQDGDPWADDSQPRGRAQSRPQGRSAPRGGTQGRSSQPRSGGQATDRARHRASRAATDIPESGEYEDERGKSWVFGKRNAPECNCHMVAAYVTGEKQNGDLWHAWGCPKGFSQTAWRDKCDLWEFTR